MQGELPLIIGRLEDFAAKLYDGLEAADWTSQRDLIRALVKRVEVARDDVNIVFRIDPYPGDADPEKKVCNFVGGVVSPILANIYLHEFDECMEQKKQGFDQSKARKITKEWRRVTVRLHRARKCAVPLTGDNNPAIQAKKDRLKQKIRELDRLQKRTLAGDPLDPGDKRLFYVRYADGTPVQA